MKTHRQWLGFVVAPFLLLTAIQSQAVESPSAGAPDAIYYQGKVVTVDDAFSIKEAFAVKDERFVAVGSNAEIRALAGKNTRQVDLRGATVIPGLSDNHDHLWNAAKYLHRGVDMVGVTAFAEMQQRLSAAVAKAKPGEVVFTTTGWSFQPAPTRKQLDQISDTVPIVIVGSRRGLGFFNSAAFARLGISKANPTFFGAKVPVDKDGELLGNAAGYPIGVYMIDSLLPPLTLEYQDLMVKRELEQRNALGITSIRELALWPEAVAGLERLRREGKLTVRMALGLEFPDQAFTAGHLAQLAPVNRDDPWLFLDSVGEEPWAPGSTTVADFTQLMRDENRLGWRPAPHVGSDVGRGISADDATNDALIGYEAADRDSPLKGKRWYIEHVPLATPDAIQRMANMGLMVSAQDFGYGVAALPSVPQERLDHYNPIKGFLDHGLVVIGGSDYSGPNPVEKAPNNPLIPFYFYVTRKSHAGEVRAPSEKISREQALRIFTTNPAYATFQEKSKGQIASGMLADFVILNQHLLTVPDDKILATHPLATFVGGKKVYSAPGSRF